MEQKNVNLIFMENKRLTHKNEKIQKERNLKEDMVKSLIKFIVTFSVGIYAVKIGSFELHGNLCVCVYRITIFLICSKH